MKVLVQQRLQLSSTCRRVATWTSRTEAVVYVLSGGARFDSVMIQSNNYCGEWLGTKSRSDRFVLYTEIN